MLFSVIIPTFNRRDLLPLALESVWQQRFADYEVIVVDDGSNDGTVEYLCSLGSRVRVFVQTNKGPGAARNLGVAEARGEYVAFLDSDDLWFPWSLETYVSVIRDSFNPAFIAGKPLVFRNEERLKHVERANFNSNKFPDYLASGDEWRWWGVSSFVVRSEVIRQIGGFAAAIINGEDADLALRLGAARGFVQITDPITFAYREHDANLTDDLTKTLAGVWHKVRTEIANGYPGGRRRMTERLRILTRHVRPVALACLRAGFRREAWQLYRTTLSWHMKLGRWKFLIGFPVRACLGRS
jgi:glycosyltransferase involved in cell wall biosynthesis